MHLTKTALLASLLALSITARGVQADTIKLADGSRLAGLATDYNGETQILSFQTDAGELMQLPLDQLDGRSVYQVHRSLVEKDNGPGQLKLANFARDAELFAHSARHYEQALEADPTLKPEIDRGVAQLRKNAAQYCVDKAKEAVAKNDLREAEKWLKTLIHKLPDEPLAAEATAALERHYQSERDAREDAVKSKNAELYEKGLDKARKSYQSMVDNTKKGLTRKKIDSQSLSAWKRAIRDGESTLKELDKLGEQQTESQTLEQIAEYRAIVIDQMVEVHLHSAYQYMTRSSYNKAMGEVNQALALDPKNSEALSTRARIADASSRGIRWFW